MDGTSSDSKQRACKKIRDQRASKDYYVQVVHTPSPDGDSELGTLDFVVTDGRDAWTAEGLGSTALKPLSVPNRVRHALEAFTDLLPSTEDYSCELRFDVDDPPELWARWVDKTHGKEFASALRAPLLPAPDPARCIAGLLDSLLANLASLRGTAGALEAQCSQWREAALKSQSQVDEYVSQRKKDEKELAEKVAALLNTKKQKLRELKEELDAARRGAGTGAGGSGGGSEEGEPMEAEGGEEESGEAEEEGEEEGGGQEGEEREGGLGLEPDPDAKPEAGLVYGAYQPSPPREWDDD